jgi:hypothetical protein
MDTLVYVHKGPIRGGCSHLRDDLLMELIEILLGVVPCLC